MVRLLSILFAPEMALHLPCVVSRQVSPDYDDKDVDSLLRGPWALLGPELSDLAIAARFAPLWISPGGYLEPEWRVDFGFSPGYDYSWGESDCHWLECGGGEALYEPDPEPLFDDGGRIDWSEVKEPGSVGPDKSRSWLGFRLRRRGRATRALESLCVRGSRWWRDLPSSSPALTAASWLVSWTSGEVKIGTPRPITVKVEGESASAIPLHLTSAGGAGQVCWVCPELVASLVCSRVFRAVDAGLLQSLRSRARLWAKERGMSDLDLSFIISGSVTFAALPQRSEVASLSLLRTDAARWSVGVLGALGQGRVESTIKLGFWESLGRAVRWSRPHGQLEPTVSGHSLSC